MRKQQKNKTATTTKKETNTIRADICDTVKCKLAATNCQWDSNVENWLWQRAMLFSLLQLVFFDFVWFCRGDELLWNAYVKNIAHCRNYYFLIGCQKWSEVFYDRLIRESRSQSYAICDYKKKYSIFTLVFCSPPFSFHVWMLVTTDSISPRRRN